MGRRDISKVQYQLHKIFNTPFLIAIACIFVFSQNGNAQNIPDFWMGTLLYPSKDSSIVYAEIDDNVYKLIDQEWEKAFDLPLYTQVNDFRIDQNGNYWILTPAIVLFSNDKGGNWEMSNAPVVYFNDMKVNGDYIYLSAYSSLYRRNISLLEQEWDKIYAENFVDFIVQNDSTLYVSKYDKNILKSSDSGLTWTETSWKNLGVGSTPGELHSNGDTIFVGTYFDGVYFSTDAGESWTKSTGLPNGRGVNHIITFNDKTIALVSDQVGTVGFYQSLDGGETFNKIDTGLGPWSEKMVDKIIVNDEGMHISAGYRGFFYSSDNGTSWSEINNGHNNLRPHHVIKIDVDPNGNVWTLMGEKSVGASPSWGIMKSADNGARWEEASDGIIDDYLEIESFAINKNGAIVASGYDPGTFHSSTDNGASWTKVELDRVTTASTIKAVGNSTFYVGTYWDGIYKSTDNGLTWESFNDGLPDGAGVGSIFIADSTKLYAIMEDQANYYGIYSKADTNAWEFKSFQKLTDIAITNTELFGFFENDVFKSTDDGVNWAEFSEGIPAESSINSILVVEDNSAASTEHIILIATTEGIYKSNADTADFTLISDINANTLVWNKPKSEVIVGSEQGVNYITIENGTFVSTEKEDVIEGFSLAQNYPNPFNPTTVISYNIKQPQQVQLFVYDITGRKVTELVNTKQTEGKYSITFNASNLASGVYIYRLQTKDFALSKRMVLIK